MILLLTVIIGVFISTILFSDSKGQSIKKIVTRQLIVMLISFIIGLLLTFFLSVCGILYTSVTHIDGLVYLFLVILCVIFYLVYRVTDTLTELLTQTIIYTCLWFVLIYGVMYFTMLPVFSRNVTVELPVETVLASPSVYYYRVSDEAEQSVDKNKVEVVEGSGNTASVIIKYSYTSENFLTKFLHLPNLADTQELHKNPLKYKDELTKLGTTRQIIMPKGVDIEDTIYVTE